MARQGIVITQGGIPIDNAADYQRVLDDRWPYMEIVKEGYIEFTYTNFAQDIVDLRVAFEHNLGYIPAFTAVEVLKQTNAPMGLEAASAIMVADKNNIYVWANIFQSGFFSDAPVTYRFYYRVFAIDVTAEFTQPVGSIAPAPKRTQTRYGARVLKEGRNDIQSKNLNDFSLNTNSKALSVYKTGISTVTDIFNPDNPDAYDGKFVVEHRLGYPPIFMIAQYMTDNTYLGGPYDALYGAPRIYALGQKLRTKADAINLTFRGGQSALASGTKWAYLILKDPLEGSS